jgi:hypothetical protein
MNRGYGKDANGIDNIIETLDQRRYLKRMAPAGVGIVRREVWAASAGFVRTG